jgi:hypothetical protein
MTKPHQEDQDEPFFITEEVEAKLTAVGYEFEPPDHGRTISLPEILAGLTDAELATWPSVLSEVEIERRRASLPRQG